ncbi:YjbH domain-containing protein [Puniceibacterium sp. IMCC21224]|uniref:YjbH domain-containing protein n=1 Tax=Puniceibacterium sp. IMCC21224 TaxID=1618204 RepID=UPI00065D86BA|nr:YjbH domain-containing protein [Puniceibacterium sp. IMCC21224]KMK68025.1 putative lipoprotein (DUF940) [Puniceibacterium sp. IMCC21224]
MKICDRHMYHQRSRRAVVTAFCAIAACSSAAIAQDRIWSQPTLNFLGVPGMIDMPTGHAMPDAFLSLSSGGFDATLRSTAHFQITPRLSGVFRYAYLDKYTGRGAYYDRSFDLRYQLINETMTLPAVSIGLQDFGGTGIYAGEYIAATKTFGRLRATGGIGWGRFGSHNGFDNPLGVLANGFKTRPDQTGGISQTGRLDVGQWFRGDAALFGGVQYQLGERTVLTAEYSSDAYVGERQRMEFDRRSSLNFGISHRFRSGLNLSGAYLYGSTLGLQLSYNFNPKQPTRISGGKESTPPLMTTRLPGSAADLGWTRQTDARAILRSNVAQIFSESGLTLESIRIDSQSVSLRMRNATYSNAAQAVGRAARILTTQMPASVERFVITPVTENGVASSRIILNRSDFEELVHAPDGAWQSFARAHIEDAADPEPGLVPRDNAFPYFGWSFGPYLSASYFDPTAPIRIDLGLQVQARYEIQPGTVLSGQVRHRLTGNRGDVVLSDSTLQKVRSDGGLYAKEGQTALTSLTAAQYFRPANDLYGRVTLGYLESMYGGLSGEILWKPVNSRLAFGLEANYVKQRSFDQGFGFQDYEVLTGHLSTYWAAANGFEYQIDAGRYLAGDWGATLSVDRTFGNGIRIGAFATLTTISFDDFGEGSFDKGIKFQIPVSVLTGKPTKSTLARTIRPVQRDGGARLNVNGRLYDSVRDYHQPELQSDWGRVWR